MNKFLTTSALALTLAALSTQEAPAWINAKLGIGANIGWQSAGNNFGWGLFRNGQPPSTDACPGVPQYPAMPHGLQQQPASVEHGVTAGVDTGIPVSPAATIPGQTQSYQRPWSTQTVNYQYPSYSYPNYYNYGYNYYNYGYNYGR